MESPSDTAGTVPRLPSTEPGSNNPWPGRGCPLHPTEPRSSLSWPDSLGSWSLQAQTKALASLSTRYPQSMLLS